MGLQGATRRGRGDEVELAAEGHARSGEAGLGLGRGREPLAPPSTGGREQARRDQQRGEGLHGASVTDPVGYREPLVSAAADRLEQYARLAVRVGRQRAAGPDARSQRAARARTARARDRAAGVRRRREIRRRPLHRPARPAGAHRAGRGRRISASRRPGSSSGSDLGETAARCLRSPATRSPSCSPTSTAPRREGADARGRRGSLALTDGLCNWSIVAYPNEGWARTVFGEPDVERLWQAVGTAVRLDEPDPVSAWREHIARLQQRADSLNEHRFDRLHYRGPGTDLTIGLHAGLRVAVRARQLRGIEHIANMPTEEVFTTPDARRVDGAVRSTLPLQIQGTIVRGLEVRFADGRAVEVRADSGEDVVRTHVATDDGAARLGEVALVDGHSRVGMTGSSSTTRSSTRTRPRTSRSALRSSTPCPGGSARTGRAARTGGEPLVGPHRFHDRVERARDRRRGRGRQRHARSCAAATGSCRAWGKPGLFARGKPGFPRGPPPSSHACSLGGPLPTAAFTISRPASTRAKPGCSARKPHRHERRLDFLRLRDVAQPGQSAAFGRRKPSVRIRPSRSAWGKPGFPHGPPPRSARLQLGRRSRRSAVWRPLGPSPSGRRERWDPGRQLSTARSLNE